MICVYVTGVATEKAISSFYYYSIFTIESPELLKATLKAFHWTQKALDQALGYFPTNKLHLMRLATALQVFETPVASAVEPWTEKTPKKVRAGRSWELGVSSPLLSSPCREQLPCSAALPQSFRAHLLPSGQPCRSWWIAWECFPEHWFATGLTQGKLLALLAVLLKWGILTQHSVQK